MRASPVNIQQIGGELAIAWSDAAESYLPLETLRRACPCAACGGEPDVIGNLVRPAVSFQANSFQLLRFQPIGGYALQLFWADGHATGLYSFDNLRRLAQTKGVS
jgi:DUF971 family protein